MKLVSSPHLPVKASVNSMMLKVLLGLLPGILIYTLFINPFVLFNIALTVASAVVFEWFFVRARGRDTLLALSDLTAVVTAVLLALALPPVLPWWMPLLGGLFAMSLGKHVYGGLGYNPFNPAMVSYIVLLISFPLEMTRWPEFQFLLSPQADFAQYWQWIFANPADAVSSATPLDHVRAEITRGLTTSEARATAPSLLPYILLGAAYLLGGMFMLWKKVIRWHIPIGLLSGLFLMALIFWLSDSDRFASPLFHLLSGAAVLGAFFIATDPVSASTTPRGRLVFGFGIGVITYCVRTWGGYADAIAFAVVLMNLCVPLIDQYTQPRVYGQGKKGDRQ